MHKMLKSKNSTELKVGGGGRVLQTRIVQCKTLPIHHGLWIACKICWMIHSLLLIFPAIQWDERRWTNRDCVDQEFTCQWKQIWIRPSEQDLVTKKTSSSNRNIVVCWKMDNSVKSRISYFVAGYFQGP
jgi:hypothetical protein